jgi:multimeric flavodoxin WrbA
MSKQEQQADAYTSRKRKIVLGLIGSERKLGNCELFTKEISRNIPEEHELRLIRLPSLKILPCRGCYHCITDDLCPVVDDLNFVLDSIVEADGIIIASPVYFLGIHAATKLMLDRGFAFYRVMRRTEDKPCILITTHGIRERLGVAPQALRALASFLCLDVKASVNVQAALPGDAINTKHHLLVARRLGKLLFDGKKRPLKGFCPYCGTDIVRAKGKGFICTLCHGTFSLDGRQRPVKIKAGWDVSSSRFVWEHRQWLKGMKDKFIARRKEVIRLITPYKTDGTWLEPR